MSDTPKTQAVIDMHMAETTAMDARFPEGPDPTNPEWRSHYRRQASEFLEHARELERENEQLQRHIGSLVTQIHGERKLRPTEAVDEWTPLSKQRPSPCIQVLFTDGELYSTGYVDQQGFFCMDINHESDPPMNPTHWMPCPTVSEGQIPLTCGSCNTSHWPDQACPTDIGDCK